MRMTFDDSILDDDNMSFSSKVQYDDSPYDDDRGDIDYNDQ